MSDNEIDEGLLARIKQGDKHAYQLLVGRYLNKMWGLCRNILGDGSEAEDVVQEVFLTVWQSRESWNPDGSAKFSTWIYRVAFNKAVDFKRRNRHSAETEEINDELAGDDAVSSETLVYRKELSEGFRKYMKRLPDRQAEALYLFYYQGLSIDEISDKMATGGQATRSLLKRGRKTLKEWLQNDPDYRSWRTEGVS